MLLCVFAFRSTLNRAGGASLDARGGRMVYLHAHRACSSVGRALQSHCRSQEFESPQVHLKTKRENSSDALFSELFSCF